MMNTKFAMKKIFILLTFLTLLFSCVKDKSYPTTFQYEMDESGVLKVDEYTAVLTDTALYIEGTNNKGTLKIKIPVEPGKPLQVRTFETDTLIDFSIEYAPDAFNNYTAVIENLELTHVNSYVNFTFDAVLSNGSVIKNGVGKNVFFKTDDNINNVDSNQTPIFPLSNLNGKANEFVSEIQGSSPIAISSLDILPFVTATHVNYTILTPDYNITLALEKPISGYLGKQIDLTQFTQDRVKMAWGSTTTSETFSFESGVFYLFEIEPTSEKITFGFNGQLKSNLTGDTKDIYVGYGKKMLTK